MKKINWRERVFAAAIHFLVTLAVAGLAALLIFRVWFPGALADLVGGKQLFFLVIGCDVTLGPLISLVIYNSTKSRWHLIADYAVIGAVQLAALAYGVFIVSGSRPAFVAFDADRLEVVTAFELDDKDLAAAVDPRFRTRPWSGPRLVYIRRPTDPKERNNLLFMEVGGMRAYLMPKYYSDYDAAKADILAKCKSLDTLLDGSGDKGAALRGAIKSTRRQDTDLCWLLVHDRFGFATALLDAHTAKPLRYVPVDPTWIK